MEKEWAEGLILSVDVAWGYAGRRGWPEVLEEFRSAADREIFGIFKQRIVALCFRERSLICGRDGR